MGSFYRSKHELVFVFKVGTAAHTNTFGLGGSGRYRTNVWDYAHRRLNKVGQCWQSVIVLVRLQWKLSFLLGREGLLTVHPLQLFGKHEPTSRHFFKCSFYGRVCCFCRALLSLGRFLTVHVRTQRHTGRTLEPQIRFLRSPNHVKPAALISLGHDRRLRGASWQVPTRRWGAPAPPRRSGAPGPPWCDGSGGLYRAEQRSPG
jgi:hypothetical protein